MVQKQSFPREPIQFYSTGLIHNSKEEPPPSTGLLGRPLSCVMIHHIPYILHYIQPKVQYVYACIQIHANTCMMYIYTWTYIDTNDMTHHIPSVLHVHSDHSTVCLCMHKITRKHVYNYTWTYIHTNVTTRHTPSVLHVHSDHSTVCLCIHKNTRKHMCNYTWTYIYIPTTWHITPHPYYMYIQTTVDWDHIMCHDACEMRHIYMYMYAWCMHYTSCVCVGVLS